MELQPRAPSIEASLDEGNSSRGNSSPKAASSLGLGKKKKKKKKKTTTVDSDLNTSVDPLELEANKIREAIDQQEAEVAKPEVAKPLEEEERI